MPLQHSRQWSHILQFSKVFLVKCYLNGTDLLPGGFGSWWNDIFHKFLSSSFFFLNPFLLPSHLLLSLRLHISQRSAFGITTLKSLSVVPTAAMTTAGELCVSESVSAIVCLIANLGAMRARMCVYSTDTWTAYFFLLWTCFVAHVCNCRSACVAQTCCRGVYPFVSIFQQHKTFFGNYRAGWHLLLQKG